MLVSSATERESETGNRTSKSQTDLYGEKSAAQSALGFL